MGIRLLRFEGLVDRNIELGDEPGTKHSTKLWERICSLNTSDTFDDQVFSRDRSCLVETADINTTSERDSERLRAEDGWTEMQIVFQREVDSERVTEPG